MKVMTSAILAAAGLGMGLSFVVGQKYEQVTEYNRQLDLWSEVLVVRGGTLVANPSALTPRDLADSQIMAKEARLIGFRCNMDDRYVGSLAVVSWDEDEMPDCQEIMTLEAAREDARHRERAGS